MNFEYGDALEVIDTGADVNLKLQVLGHPTAHRGTVEDMLTRLAVRWSR